MNTRRIRAYMFSGGPLLVAALLAGAGLFHAAQQTAPVAAEARQAQRLDLAGVPNFGSVTPMLFRGGQPTEDGLKELKKFGVELVVNFRDDRGEIESERREVEALGLRYANIPWNARHKPSGPQVAEFLQLLRANPQTKIFLHCHHGADRTGVMVAAYRIAEQNWSAAEALAEMGAFHYHHFWLPHLKEYIEDFPKQLAADPSLRALKPSAQTSAP